MNNKQKNYLTQIVCNEYAALFWVKGRVDLKKLIVYLSQSNPNKGNYFPKHYPSSHHIRKRSQYINDMTPKLSL